MTTRSLIARVTLLTGLVSTGPGLSAPQPPDVMRDDANLQTYTDDTLQITTKLNQAEQALRAGDLNKARQAVLQAKIRDNKAGGPRTADIALMTASVQFAAGQYARVVTTLSALLETRPHNTPMTAAAYNNRGNAYMAQTRVQFALSDYEQADRIPNIPPVLRVKIGLNRARAYHALDRGADAFNALQQAITLLHALPARDRKLALLLTAAERLEDLSSATDRGNAIEKQRYHLLRDAETLATRQGNDQDRAHALGALGRLYTERGRDPEALTLVREALFYAQRANAAPQLVRVHWQLAQLHTRRGDASAALNAYREALALLKAHSDQLSVFSAGARDASIDALLKQAADAVLQQAVHERSPERRTAYLEEVRQIIELTRAESLKRYYRDDCVADLQNRTQGIERIDPRTLVIYPIAFADRLDLVISGYEFITHVRVPVTRQALDHALYNFRMNLQLGSRAIYQYSAQEVYRWLIQPLEPLLKAHQPDTLVFVPNATLQMVPLAALHDGHQYLIERFAVVTTPGLALTDPQTFKDQRLRMLIAGISDSVQGFADLPYVKKEVKALADHYQSVLLMNQAFTLPAMEKTLTKTAFPVLHLASHGRFEPDARASYILAYDKKMGIDDIQSVLTAGRFLDTPVELLTLSACSTALGDAQSALGLGGLAVKSGARTALASLWLVNDQATAALMQAFYRHLAQPETSRARALQRAQQQMLAHPQLRNPLYWSAFVLVGNWQ